MPVGEVSTNVTAVCAVCKKTFACPTNQGSRRECCTASHDAKGKACVCCWHQYKRLKTFESYNGKIEYLTKRKEIRQLLGAAKKIGPGFYLAFQLAINGMLYLHELVRLKISDLVRSSDDDRPCVLKIGSATVEMNCETIDAFDDWTRGKAGRLFSYSRRMLQRKFRETTKLGHVFEYQFHALRHTGIMLRAACVRNLSDLEALRKAARFKSLKQLYPYLSAETSSLLTRVRPAR